VVEVGGAFASGADVVVSGAVGGVEPGNDVAKRSSSKASGG
jgi:hypothetical protein